ncbi:hypothetical protein BDN70DRAFT_963100 [Pholiota conissans]|uniref:Uncharacterized protein n=1 Tax=Pholiota conissans TaxID=109636 RepID=A0A9P5Z966_9AGAR|nr:hypothetical protein BDN70DRAFT_963100 [Pholiota conissans]
MLPLDVTVLNYALTLEHLENAFYHGALEKFSEQAFVDAGMPGFARRRFEQVAAHEATHVKFLSTALGDKATQPCTYNFPYTDVRSFAALSQILEGVGVSTYTGAAQFISNKEYLTAAASILATEARHESWVSSAINRFAGWSGAFDVPLGLNEVFTLAAPFITECPTTNPVLPVHPFPKLVLHSPSPGQPTHIVWADNDARGATHIAFYTGLNVIPVPIQDGSVVVPADVDGTVYAVAITSDSDANDSTIVAGPAILLFERNSNNVLIESSQAN